MYLIMEETLYSASPLLRLQYCPVLPKSMQISVKRNSCNVCFLHNICYCNVHVGFLCHKPQKCLLYLTFRRMIFFLVHNLFVTLRCISIHSCYILFHQRTVLYHSLKNMSTNEEIFFSFSPSGQWTSLLLSVNVYYKIKQLRR